MIFRSLSYNTPSSGSLADQVLLSSLAASDPSEAQIFSAQSFLDSIYGDSNSDRGRNSRAQTPMTSVSSRAQTPMTVWNPLYPGFDKKTPSMHPASLRLYPHLPRVFPGTHNLENSATKCDEPRSSTLNMGNTQNTRVSPSKSPYNIPNRIKASVAKLRFGNLKDTIPAPSIPRRQLLQRVSALPRVPDVSHLAIDVDSNSEHVVLVSMYEVYNDRIFDLLSPSMPSGPGARQGINQKNQRRPLIFKSTENSPDRKVVAGLRKVVCRTYEEALMVLETGLGERRVTGTGSNSVSSRSHGFFCLEIKKKVKGRRYGEETWASTTLTVVDLAGEYMWPAD